MKKLFAVLLALALVLSMGTMALAADTGSITINKAVEGETYEIYRIFDLESYDAAAGNYSYKLSDKWADFEADEYFTINTAGYVEWHKSFDDDAEDVKAFVELAAAYAKTIAADGSATADSTTVTIGNLPLGYYLVDTSVGSLCSITTTNPAAEVNEKNAKPDLVKKIVEDGNLVDANNAAIGETVTYQTTVTVGKGVKEYVVHDKMSNGLTFVDENEDDKIDVTITANGVAVDAASYAVTHDVEDDCTFEISFEDDYIKTLDAGTEIVITYAATLNENAVVGATGNPNTASLEYKNETEVEETVEDTVITYTTKFVVDKVDGQGKPLAGAGFTLYKEEGDNNWVAVGAEILIDSLQADEEAIYTWNGLAEGNYKLVETTIPEGYNKANDIKFTLDCAEPDTVDSADATADWTETLSDQVAESVDDADKALDVFEATVENKTGSLLPETGGIGTTIFYIIGGLLMIGAAVLLISKKRMAATA